MVDPPTPDFDVVVVSAGIRVVVVTDAVVLGEEPTELDEQLASTIGSVKKAMAVIGFLEDLIAKLFPM